MKVDAAMQRMPLQAVNTSAQRVNEETSNTPQALREDSVSLSSVNKNRSSAHTNLMNDHLRNASFESSNPDLRIENRWGYLPPE